MLLVTEIICSYVGHMRDIRSWMKHGRPYDLLSKLLIQQNAKRYKKKSTGRAEDKKRAITLEIFVFREENSCGPPPADQRLPAGIGIMPSYVLSTLALAHPPGEGGWVEAAAVMAWRREFMTPWGPRAARQQRWARRGPLVLTRAPCHQSSPGTHETHCWSVI